MPIPMKDSNVADMEARLLELDAGLKEAGLRTQVDAGTSYTPGWKFSHWELKGVPLRLELGPKDMQNKSARLVRRDTNEKIDVKWAELPTKVPELLEAIHKNLY